MTEQVNEIIAANALLHLSEQRVDETALRRRMVIFIEMYLIDNGILDESQVQAFATFFEKYYFSLCSSFDDYSDTDRMELVLASFIKTYNIRKI